MRPVPGEVLHFSEDPTITRFNPHVAATARQPDAYVWAVDHGRAPDYWFPRQCPRAMAWAEATTDADDRAWLGSPRVHAIEYGWLRRVQTARLYAYRFDAGPFRPIGDPPHAHVATEAVEPLGAPEPVGDLLALHEEAGIELRVVADLWPFWRRVTASTLGFSGIRLRNAAREPG
ncbi:DUF6886 family protein [Saccharothrix lopnurensis]|uniref:DUF6886 family protein n=1 Tax=Saccharothrix lopnurensis TaxID=1670621 RepID=UPI0036D41CBD